jgi:hypothetical protein
MDKLLVVLAACGGASPMYDDPAGFNGALDAFLAAHSK